MKTNTTIKFLLGLSLALPAVPGFAYPTDVGGGGISDRHWNEVDPGDDHPQPRHDAAKKAPCDKAPCTNSASEGSAKGTNNNGEPNLKQPPVRHVTPAEDHMAE